MPANTPYAVSRYPFLGAVALSKSNPSSGTLRPTPGFYYRLHRQCRYVRPDSDHFDVFDLLPTTAGTAIVETESARLFTDGRYFLQAGQQLDSNWTLMKHGEKGESRHGRLLW